MSELDDLLNLANDLSRILDLRAAQELGELPKPGQIGPKALAEAFGMSAAEYRRYEAALFVKTAHLLGGDAEELLSLIPTQHDPHKPLKVSSRKN